MLGRLGTVLATAIAAGVIGTPALVGNGALLARMPDTAPAATEEQPVVVAHRGASAYAPENTMAAIEESGPRGADVVEIDVQRTKDDELVLMHDVTLERTTDVEDVFPSRDPWNVGDFTLAELRKLDAGSWFDAEFSGERVPTLGGILDELGGDSSNLGLLLEVKSPELYPGIAEDVADELENSAMGRGSASMGHDLVVQSFDWEFVRTFEKIRTDVPAGLLGTPEESELSGLAEYATHVNPRHADVSRSYIDSIHDHDMRAYTWTVDDRVTAHRMIAAGVDGIVSNRPDVIRAAVDRTSPGS